MAVRPSCSKHSAHYDNSDLQMASKADDDSERYKRIPESLRLKMMAFQREGVRFALAHGGRVLIGDEMGAAGWRSRCQYDVSGQRYNAHLDTQLLLSVHEELSPASATEDSLFAVDKPTVGSCICAVTPHQTARLRWW